jgi:hypothetical protein
MRERLADLPIGRHTFAGAGEGLPDVLSVRPLRVGWRRFRSNRVSGRAVIGVRRIT